MRFRLILEIDKKAYGNVMPINYQYEQSTVIYRLLSKGNEKYAAWLHDNGFNSYYKKTFKLFCYSPFKIEKRKQIGDRLLVLSDTIEWQISFLSEQSTEEFIKGVFTDQTFCIYDAKSCVQLHIRSVEAMSEPEFKETMVYSTMSPLFIKQRHEGENDEHLRPDDPRSADLLKYSTLEKYHAFYGKPFEDPACECKFETLSELKRKKITIKAGSDEASDLIGYLCKLRITAPIELQRIIYYAGLGGGCSQGFGYLRIINIKDEK